MVKGFCREGSFPVSSSEQEKKTGRYVLKVGEILKDWKEGRKRLESLMKECRKVRLSNLPLELLERWLKILAGRDEVQCEIYQPEEQLETLKRKWETEERITVERLGGRWYQNFLGEKLYMGEVLTDEELFHLLWKEDGGKEQVRRVFVNTDPKCTTCIWKKNFMKNTKEEEHCFCTVYDRKKGVDLIVEHGGRAEVFRACILPPRLIHRILPHALKKDFKIILSRKDPLVERLKKLRNISKIRIGSDAKIYFLYGGDEANVGSLRLDHVTYSIFWRDDNIYNIQKFDDLTCSNCIGRVFDTAWKYSQKLDEL